MDQLCRDQVRQQILNCCPAARRDGLGPKTSSAKTSSAAIEEPSQEESHTPTHLLGLTSLFCKCLTPNPGSRDLWARGCGCERCQDSVYDPAPQWFWECAFLNTCFFQVASNVECRNLFKKPSVLNPRYSRIPIQKPMYKSRFPRCADLANPKILGLFNVVSFWALS